MNEGTLLGRIGSVRGESGFVPHFRLPVSLSYQGSVTEALDIVNVKAAAYIFYAKSGVHSQTGNYLGHCHFDPYGSLGSLFPGNPSAAWAFLLPANHGVLHQIEQERKGRDVVLSFVISVYAIPRDLQDRSSGITAIKLHDAAMPGNAHCMVEISKSKWLELLKNVGYGEYHLAEIPLPRIKKVKALNASLQNVQRAWEHFLNGNDRETLAACHDALEKLAKDSVNPNSKPDQNAFSKILSGVGPPEKTQKIAQVLSQCTSLLHLGRHEHKPAVELDHRDAELAILLTHACIAYLSKTNGSARTVGDAQRLKKQNS
jgi:hypothetical protein